VTFRIRTIAKQDASPAILPDAVLGIVTVIEGTGLVLMSIATLKEMSQDLDQFAKFVAALEAATLTQPPPAPDAAVKSVP
jgi:hypothetical protein